MTSTNPYKFPNFFHHPTKEWRNNRAVSLLTPRASLTLLATSIASKRIIVSQQAQTGAASLDVQPATGTKRRERVSHARSSAHVSKKPRCPRPVYKFKTSFPSSSSPGMQHCSRKVKHSSEPVFVVSYTHRSRWQSSDAPPVSFPASGFKKFKLCNQV